MYDDCREAVKPAQEFRTRDTSAARSTLRRSISAHAQSRDWLRSSIKPLVSTSSLHLLVSLLSTALDSHEQLRLKHKQPPTVPPTDTREEFYKMLTTISTRLTFLRSLLPRTRFLHNPTVSFNAASKSPFSTLLRSSISPSALSRSSPLRMQLQSTSTRQCQTRGMKTRSSVKRLCESCKVRYPHPHRLCRPKPFALWCFTYKHI